MGTVKRKVNTENATQMSVLNYPIKWAIKLLSASWRKWLKKNFNITWFLPFFSRLSVFFFKSEHVTMCRLHFWMSLWSPTMVILIPCFLMLKLRAEIAAIFYLYDEEKHIWVIGRVYWGIENTRWGSTKIKLHMLKKWKIIKIGREIPEAHWFSLHS